MSATDTALDIRTDEDLLVNVWWFPPLTNEELMDLEWIGESLYFLTVVPNSDYTPPWSWSRMNREFPFLWKIPVSRIGLGEHGH